MRHCGSLGLSVSDRRSDIGSDRRTDILTEHHRAGHIERNEAHAEHDEGDGHRSG